MEKCLLWKYELLKLKFLWNDHFESTLIMNTMRAIFGHLINSNELYQRNAFHQYIMWHFSICSNWWPNLYSLHYFSIYGHPRIKSITQITISCIPLKLYIFDNLVHMLLDLTIRSNCLVSSCMLNPLLQVWWRLRFDGRVWTLVEAVLLIWSKLVVDFSPTDNQLICIFDIMWRRKLLSSIKRKTLNKFWNYRIRDRSITRWLKLKFTWNTFSYVFISVSVYDWICDGTTHSN